jgi:tetratricopeptide (TPR) repeat protein
LSLFDESLNFLQKYLEHEHNNCDAYNLLGIILIEKNMLDDAILNFNKCFKVKYSTLSVIDAVLGVLLPFFLVFAFNLTKYKFKLLAEESLQNKCDDNSKIINTLSHGISITKDV